MKLTDLAPDKIRRRHTKFQLKQRKIGGLIDENTLRWSTIGPLMVCYEGGVRVCGIAVFRLFWCGISVKCDFILRYCGIA